MLSMVNQLPPVWKPSLNIFGAGSFYVLKYQQNTWGKSALRTEIVKQIKKKRVKNSFYLTPIIETNNNPEIPVLFIILPYLPVLIHYYYSQSSIPIHCQFLCIVFPCDISVFMFWSEQVISRFGQFRFSGILESFLPFLVYLVPWSCHLRAWHVLPLLCWWYPTLSLLFPIRHTVLYPNLCLPEGHPELDGQPPSEAQPR